MSRNPFEQPEKTSGERSRRQEPPPLDDVHEDARAIERNLRRYVNYRFADLAPIDGTFYRRHRVEIWGALILLAILATSFFDVYRALAPGDDSGETTTSRRAESQNRPAPPPSPAGSDEPAPEPASSAVSGPLASEIAAIRADPDSWWRNYLREEPERVVTLIEAMLDRRGLDGRDRVSVNQSRNFTTWKNQQLHGSPNREINLRTGLFEYLMIRWRTDGRASLEGNSKVDLVLSRGEHPADAIEAYLEAFGIRGAFDDLPDDSAEKASVQVAVIAAWLAKGES